MPLVHKMSPFWQCALCGHEVPARNINKPPRNCSSCKDPDWLAGDGTGKQKKAKRLRPVGKKMKVVQQSSQTVLRIVRRAEIDRMLQHPTKPVVG